MMVDVTKKLDLLWKLESKMHPLNQTILRGVSRAFEEDELKENDLEWIDNMINAIEPIDKNGGAK